MEGIIKYNLKWTKAPLAGDFRIAGINKYRERLFELGYLGINHEGISYGNVSVRETPDATRFIITGTDTGRLRTLSAEHYTRVTDFNIEKNTLSCIGPIKASSESMTHAVVYRGIPDANAVIHIHDYSLWEKYLHVLPATSPESEYGTQSMARDIRTLIEQNPLTEKTIVMGGHEEGIISFGKDIKECFETILKLSEKSP